MRPMPAGLWRWRNLWLKRFEKNCQPGNAALPHLEAIHANRLSFFNSRGLCVFTKTPGWAV